MVTVVRNQPRPPGLQVGGGQNEGGQSDRQTRADFVMLARPAAEALLI